MRTTAERREAEALRRAPLHLKISVYVAVGLAVIFALLGLLGLYAVNQGTREAMNGRLAIARLAAFHLDAELSEQFATMEAAAPALSPILAAGQAPAAPEVETEPSTLAVAVLDRRGQVRWSGGLGKALAQRLAPEAILARVLAGQARATSPVFTLPGGRPAVALLVPVRAGGAVVGAIAEALDPTDSHISEFIREASRLGATGHAELIDQQGQVITATEPGRTLAPGEHPDLYRRVLAQGKAQVGTSAEWQEGHATGDRHIMAVAPLQSAPWLLAIGGSEQEMLAPARQWEGLLLLAGFFSLLAALGLVWVTTQAVARPVRQLTAAAQRIAAGDLGYPVPQGADGEVGQLAGSFDDMRQRLAAALHDLRVEKSQYEAAFGAMADALFTVDEHFRIATFNPAAERLTGLSAAEVRGRHCHEVFQPEEEGVCAACPLIQLDGRPATAVDGVQHFRTPGGRRLSVATACSPIRGEDGRVVGMVHVMRDVSAREQLDRLKDEFISTVSHELRTPLGFIKGYATTLLRPDAHADQRTRRRFLRIIDQASDELQGLVDNLLDVSKIGAGALQLHPAPLDPAALVRRAASRARRGAREHRFSVSLPRSLPPVQGDQRRLEQVLDNLLGNAVKYSPAGSLIQVTARAEGGAVCISVADEGIGLPPGDLEAVFERFYRSPEAMRRGIGGTGLGLAICKGIVAAHGGRIWAANRPGGGSVFSFSLPVATAKAEEAGVS